MMISRILLMVLGFSLLLCTPVYAASHVVGKVLYTTGDAWIERNGEKQDIENGFQLLGSDIIETGERGRVKLQMVDGSKVYIGSKSRLGLSKYTMRGKNLFQASLNMLWGKARFFVNKLVARDASFRIRTSTAVLGVRGTSIFVQVPKDGSSVSYTLITGYADVYPLDKDGNKMKGQRVLAGQTIIVHADGSITVRKATKEEMGKATAAAKEDGSESGLYPTSDGASTIIQNKNGTTPAAPAPVTPAPVTPTPPLQILGY